VTSLRAGSCGRFLASSFVRNRTDRIVVWPNTSAQPDQPLSKFVVGVWEKLRRQTYAQGVRAAHLLGNQVSRPSILS
jgi:hypothetical protein